LRLYFTKSSKPINPADESLAILDAEFQGYDDGLIYVRIVQEMAMLRSQHPKREFRGLVIFLESHFIQIPIRGVNLLR